MRKRGRRAAVAAAALAGMAAGVVATLIFADTDEGAPTRERLATVRPTSTTMLTTTVPMANEPDVLLVWTSGGLPPGLADRVRSLDGVDLVTLVHGDETAMMGSSDQEGEAVDTLVDGWRIPLDTLAVEPTTFASFLTGPAADAAGSLRPGEALLTETSAELRRVDVGATIRLDGGAVTVVGVVDDLSGAGAELIVTADDAPTFGVTTERYLLIQHSSERADLERTIAQRFLGGSAVRFRTPAETTWLRHGDAVQPNIVVKAAFGEFAFRAGAGRSVEISPEWVDRWIVTDSVPILGEISCHRKVFDPLRAALHELSDAGLGHLIDPADFAGCFSPRRIEAGQPLSHHAWGAALDLNVDGNPRGSFSTQDRRLVDTMAHHGFTWGGAWLVPDPAHYEAPLG